VEAVQFARWRHRGTKSAVSDCILFVDEDGRCCAADNDVEEALEFVRSPVDVTVTEGEDASFECQLLTPETPGPTGSTASVSWFKDDDLIPADDADFKQTFDGHVALLYIAETYLDDAGVYTCTARTSDGRHEASIAATLVVNGQFNRDSNAFSC